VQEGLQAQQQSQQGLQGATQQAANALAQAAQSLAQASQASQAQGQGQQPGQPGQAQGNEPGKEPSPTPGNAKTSKEGIKVVKGGQDTRPTSVKELGISPADWAKLNPLMQQELLNAAQQSGPPEYQEMIKNYYTRVARIEDDEARRPPAEQPK
jgi:hypothetical protein